MTATVILVHLGRQQQPPLNACIFYSWRQGNPGTEEWGQKQRRDFKIHTLTVLIKTLTNQSSTAHVRGVPLFVRSTTAQPGTEDQAGSGWRLFSPHVGTTGLSSLRPDPPFWGATQTIKEHLHPRPSKKTSGERGGGRLVSQGESPEQEDRPRSRAGRRGEDLSSPQVDRVLIHHYSGQIPST